MLQQSNLYIDDIDTMVLMETINSIYSVIAIQYYFLQAYYDFQERTFKEEWKI